MTRTELVVGGGLVVAYIVYRIHASASDTQAAAAASAVDNASAPASAQPNSAGEYPSAGGAIPEEGSGYYGLAGAGPMQAISPYDDVDQYSIENLNPVPQSTKGVWVPDLGAFLVDLTNASGTVVGTVEEAL